jgi:hypothetical protein
MSLFSFGGNNTAVCPSKTPVVIDAGACEVAADAAGRPYGGPVALEIVPYGCVWYSAGGSFYFNAYTSGSNNEGWRVHESAQPVCAGTLLPHSKQTLLLANEGIDLDESADVCFVFACCYTNRNR